MTHLGERLSALIDGELDCDERDRVLGHLARCGGCRDEAAALRTLKRRMNALGETAAGAALTGRLIGLSSEGGVWPQPRPSWSSAPDWPAGPGGASVRGAARYFLAGSFAVFLAGLGTAAFIAGGDPQAQIPSPRVTPSVDVLLQEHDGMTGLYLHDPLRERASPASGFDRPRTLP
jgi:anti-sigma factor RsiW